MPANINPDWGLTKTMSGVPIAITRVIQCRGANGAVTGHEFLVIPNYNNGSTGITGVKAEDARRPKQFKDLKQEELFKDIIFGDDNKDTDDEESSS